MPHLIRNISCLPPELCLASLSMLHHVLTCGALRIDRKKLKLMADRHCMEKVNPETNPSHCASADKEKN